MPPSLSSLISLWEQARAQGLDVPADELCRDCPENAERLERILATLRASEPPEESGPDETLVRETRRVVTQPHLTPPGYEVIEVLGRGGMGIVYRAKQLGLERVVALKMIIAGAHASAEDRSRFQAEAEAVAAIHHPGIVQVYQSDTHEGLPFLAMELCAGGSLSDRLRGMPLPPAEAARMVESMARAIEHAHSKGVIHRDLKPANVLLDDKGEPKITDFGLAKRLQREDVTVTGAVMGTPSYMPPEQARGDKVGPLADVYSLGATLYECLTGLPPFRAASRDETMRQLLDSEPVPVRTLQPRTPRDLETICHKCLSKEPHRRYASAKDLADDLARFHRGEPIKARPVSFVERTAKWVRRRPTLAALWLAILFLLGSVLGIWIVGTFRLERERQEAERQRDLAREETARADWFRELVATELEDPFGNEGGLYRISPALGERQTFMQTLASARDKADRRLQDGPIKAAVLDAIGNAYVTLGQQQDAHECLTAALRMRQEQWEDNPRDAARRLDYARSLHSLGKFHHERGLLEHDDYREARSYYRRSLEITEAKMDDPASCLQALLTRFLLAWLACEEERFDESIAGFDEVMALHKRHVEQAGTFDKHPHRRRHADRLRALAKVGKAAIPVENETVMHSLTFVEGFKAYLAAIDELVEHENDPTFRESYRDFEQGVEALLVVHDPRVRGEQKERRLAQAIERLSRARDRLAVGKGTNQLYYSLSLLFLGEAFVQRGQWKEAAGQLETSLAVGARSVGYQHSKVQYVAHEYARALRHLGQQEKGRAVFAEVVGAVAKRYGKGHFLYANALMHRGNFLRDCRQFAEAEATFREALAIYQKTGGRKRKYYPRCVDDLAAVLEQQGRPADAAQVRAEARQAP